MKKSLSVLLSATLAIGSFASVVSAADADLTAQQKFEALKAKGVFAGMADGSAGLDQSMTRAQYARIAALLLGLEGIGNPDTKVVTQKPFSDVDLGKWYTEEIAAVKEAGAMSGNANGTFNPGGNITNQELAAALGQLLKLTPVEGAQVEGAADWAAGYIKALEEKGFTVPTPYTANATREALVNGAYLADNILNPAVPEKVSVASAKAAGVHKVEVTLDKAVETSKATFTVKKGTTTLKTGDVTWSDDKKVATIEIPNVKISEGTYSVTLGGLDSSEIASATSSFTAEDETVSKLEFVTASDEIAKSSQAKVKLRAVNQYGELASFGASSYTATVSGQAGFKSMKKDDEGYLIITLDTASNDLLTGVSVVPIYVYFDDNRVTAQKTFKIGTAPFVSKMDLGEVVYNSDEKALSSAGETATIPVNLYDQYGNPVTPEQADADKLNVNINEVISPYNTALDAKADTDDDNYIVKVSVKDGEQIEKAQSHTVTVYAGSASASTTVDVNTSAVAMKAKIGDFGGVIAEGDTDVYIPLIVTDANGEELSPSDIVDNKDRIDITSSGLGSSPKPQLVTMGEHKGQIRIYNVTGSADSYATLSVAIMTQNANSYDYKQYKIQDPRVPETIKVSEKPATKAVLGGSTDFTFQVLDQYGDELDYDKSDYYVQLAVQNESGTVSSAVYDDDNAVKLASVGQSVYFGNITAPGVVGDIKKLNDGLVFDSVAGDKGKTKVVATLKKVNGAVDVNSATDPDDEVDSESFTVESIPNDTKLYYSLESVGTMYAAIDNELLGTKVTDPLLVPSTSQVAVELKLVVRDAAGNTVAYPSTFQSVAIANGNILKQQVTPAGKAFIIGDEAGTTSLTAVFKQADGNSKTLSATVTTKNDVITAKTIKADNDDVTLAAAKSATDLGTLMGLKVTDNYGNDYEDGEVYAYDAVLGIRYVVSDIQGQGTVTVEDSGSGFKVNVVDEDSAAGKTVTGFVIEAISRDGTVTAATVVGN